MQNAQALAMPTTNREAVAVLSEMGIAVVAKNVRPKPGETRAIGTVQRIIRNHGMDHARLALMILSESENCKGYLSEAIIGATADLLLVIKRNYPSVYENRLSDVFSFFDQTPIAAIEYRYVRALDGLINRRTALAGLLYERFVRAFGEPQMDMLDDRRVMAAR